MVGRHRDFRHVRAVLEMLLYGLLQSRVKQFLDHRLHICVLQTGVRILRQVCMVIVQHV